MFDNYGTVQIDRTEYEIVQQPYLTSRLFYGSFNDRYSDGTYEIEYQATAVAKDGSEVQVIWHFPSEIFDTDFYNQDESNLPWDMYYTVTK